MADEAKPKAHPVGRARGDAVLVRIVSVEVEKRGRSTSCRLALVTQQAVSRLRPGDAVALRGRPGFTLKIVEVHGGWETVLVAELSGGVKRARAHRGAQL